MSRKIREMNLPVKVVDCFSLPMDETAFLQEIGQVKRVLTVEDGILSGGLGSMILEMFNDRGIHIPVIRKGIRLMDGMPKIYLNRDMIFDREQLTDTDLREIIQKLLEG